MKPDKPRRKCNYKPYDSTKRNMQREELSALTQKTFQRGKTQGFDYYLSKETIKRYQEKSPELRLKWLYLGNLFRKKYPKNIIRLHNKFREGI